eukprot:Protomagalhaensia_wolfi_Nauph_80__2675@NODE_2807_length_981_cov_1094_664544_g2204_i0_p1_GENE_NODE_2807_length_981_cov_1094_664544_g2204_i0NODE_2807_length_981_cov_1094_664544_g2204_i0_p1_ORF_typecomplete_len150_score35_92LIDHydrolase/PF10230_9/0_053CDPOH_P_transf/PF01066_21/3_5_NODE_2807_length_981_cov_1094_664544_g2204_i0226675
MSMMKVFSPPNAMIWGGALLGVQGASVSIVAQTWTWLAILLPLAALSIACRWVAKTPRIVAATACLFISLYRGIRDIVSLRMFAVRGVRPHAWFDSAGPIYFFTALAMISALLNIACYGRAFDIHKSDFKPDKSGAVTEETAATMEDRP